MASFVGSQTSSGVEIPRSGIHKDAASTEAMPSQLDLGLPSSETAELLKRGTQVRIGRQRILFGEGESVDRLFVVESGSFKRVRQSRDGRELILSLVGVGDLFGAIASPIVATNQVQALQDSICFSIPVTAVHRAIEHHPPLAVRLLGLMHARQREAEATAARFALETVPQRLAHLILTISDPRSGELRFPLNQTEIANVIGSSRETVCSILNRLRRDGILALSRGRIRILERQHLADTV
ncbi:MAG TPA: Crp/Fnr family transcriptional regulator [Vicinamibacteria bacterium]|nr:Crp/Fnr family transcriptional regulator [Vicinamibacteria bacterium]